MNFNLTKLADAINSKYRKPLYTPVQFHLTEDGSILAKSGEVSYYFDYKKLQDVLDANEFEHYYQIDSEDKIYDLLSKHIINQHTASLGKKVYPEIKSILSDINQWD